MRRSIPFLMMLAIAAAVVEAAAQRPSADDQRALRERIEQRYDVVPLTGGVALRPKSRMNDVRLIEITDTIAVNGVPISGRELRDRVGADADSILRLSYLDADVRRELFAGAALEAPERPERPEPSRTPGTSGTSGTGRARQLPARAVPAGTLVARRSGADLRRRVRARGRTDLGGDRGRHGFRPHRR